MQPPILKTQRLILRPIELSDAVEHRRHMKDYEIVRNFADTFPHPYPDNGSEWFINHINGQDKIIYWAIALKTAPQTIIGAIELRPEQDTSQRAFWLSREHQKQGFITEAATAVNDYWFDVLGKETLHLENALGNAASRRIKEKTGADFLGTCEGKYVDPALTMTEQWLIRKEDWKAFRGSQPSNPLSRNKSCNSPDA